MPIIAESPPLALEIEPTPSPATPVPTTPTPIIKPSDILTRHEQFIRGVDATKACFVRNSVPGFTDDEFDLHIKIAKIDKYVVEVGDKLYCSMEGINKLTKALERVK